MYHRLTCAAFWAGVVLGNLPKNAFSSNEEGSEDNALAGRLEENAFFGRLPNKHLSFGLSTFLCF